MRIEQDVSDTGGDDGQIAVHRGGGRVVWVTPDPLPESIAKRSPRTAELFRALRALPDDERALVLAAAALEAP